MIPNKMSFQVKHYSSPQGRRKCQHKERCVNDNKASENRIWVMFLIANYLFHTFVINGAQE